MARRRGLLLATGTLLVCSLACGDGAGDTTGAAAASASGPGAASRAGQVGGEPSSDAPRLDGAGGVRDEHTLELLATVERRPDDAAANRELAHALRGLERTADSVYYFERAAALDPGPQSLLELALAYAAVSRGEEAEATYRRLLEQVPNHAIALHNLGNLAMKRGSTPEAARWYGAAVQARPDYLLAWFHLGEALNQGGRYREAYRAYERALELEPSNADELSAYDDSLYRLASLDMMMGATDRAEQMLEALLEANPGHHAANYAYAQLLLAQGREAEAQRALERHAEVMANAPTLQAMSDPALDLRDSK